jgi:PKD repeat protein
MYCPVIRCLLIILLLVLAQPVAAAEPISAFTGTPLTGPAPLAVQFTDASTNTPTGWAWYFGDETWTGIGWTLQSTGPWATYRAGHESGVLPDGSIILTGGMDQSTNPPTSYADVWRSTDKGVTWSIQSSSPGWLARSGHSCNILPDGSIILTGGANEVTIPLTLSFNDTWRSADKGATWSLQSPAPAWPARESHTSVALPDGSIVLMGGVDNKSVYYNDTWRSADKGATWSLVSAQAPWIARWGHTSVVLPDGSIILMGGRDAAVTNYNDIWRSPDNGTTWSLVSATAPWIARTGHTSVVMPDGSIILMGGYSASGDLNDVWRSTDQGASWTELADHAEWIPRFGHTSVVLPDASIIISGGNALTGSAIMLNNSWRLATANAAQNPSHTYTQAGTYTVTEQAYNADGWSRVTRADYVTVSGTAPTPSPVPTVTTAPAPTFNGGDDTPRIVLRPMNVTVNIGGNSAAASATVTGTGLSDLVVTGTPGSSPGSGISPPPGTAYQYIDLVPARYTSITNAAITFTVPQAWLDEHHVAPQDIAMYHSVNGQWVALPTTVAGTQNGIVTFTATSPGFSLFAIAGTPVTPEAPGVRTIGDLAAGSGPAADSRPSPQAPIVTQTTAVVAPLHGQAPEIPLPLLALAGLVVLAAGGFFVRRWWIRRQNPALFERTD